MESADPSTSEVLTLADVQFDEGRCLTRRVIADA
jgi:hypothetical protein